MTVPGKRTATRQYVRKFDYDEARVRHAAGETQGALAREYGVSRSRINQVVNPRVGEAAAARANAYRWYCPDCGAETRKKDARCNPCAALALSTTSREDTLRCCKCGEWKPDEEFYRAVKKNVYARRGRRNHCKACDIRARQNYRARHYEQEQEYWRSYSHTRRRHADAETD